MTKIDLSSEPSSNASIFYHHGCTWGTRSQHLFEKSLQPANLATTIPAAQKRASISGNGGGLEVQIFGTQKNQDTRKALRFFSERRVKAHFVDLMERAASSGELLRFVQKLGVTALIDRASARYRDLGLAVVRYDDERWLRLLCEEPLVLRQPLVRSSNRLTVGLAESDWRSWIDAEKAR